MNKLALGSVQFGMPYGVASGYKQASFEDVVTILQSARKSGIHTLDTAINYGDSETILGRVGVNDWDIVSKLPAIPENTSDITAWLNESVNSSLERLNVPSLYAILLHQPEQLLSSQGEALYTSLTALKAQGIVKKIGISIYDVSILDEIEHRFPQDLVQAPFNILDRRIETSGWLDTLYNRNIELHIRSVFLQGLLLMGSFSRPKSFNKWNNIWSNWDEWLRGENITALQACLSHALANDKISKVIVGVDNQKQLIDIINASKDRAIEIPAEFISTDVELIEPSRWS
jgi:aryl-alcohol dehydrogenase-like predicted oxidoreductase